MPIGGLGMGEIILIFLVVLLLFGAKRLPEIGSALGKGIREFKSSVREIEGELKAPLEDKRRMAPPRGESGEGAPRRLAGTEEGERSEPRRLRVTEEEEQTEPRRLDETEDDSLS
ncbi:MAG: twin-arginine translocase TatA/TatE family subunit [Gemmatimonadota bacterium]|jgi:sec-independent protein translocase protein TatA